MMVCKFICLLQISHFKVGNFIVRADSVMTLKHFSQKKQQQFVKKAGLQSKMEINFILPFLKNYRTFALFATQKFQCFHFSQFIKFGKNDKI